MLQFKFLSIFYHLLSPRIHDTYNCERADENLLAKPFSLPYIFLELSTNRDMYSMHITCDDLLRQYHFFTVLHWESENFAGGSVRSASLQFFIPILSLLYYHFNSNPTADFLFLTKATSSNYSFICTNIQGSSILWRYCLSIKKLISSSFNATPLFVSKNPQSPKSTMPTKIICPARISAMLLKEDG